ncbi:hypothetical protein L1887_33971 [Cichorium endivia]|nr:hypothetical protein L1887_33971 [Cichorium endivia]
MSAAFRQNNGSKTDSLLPPHSFVLSLFSNASLRVRFLQDFFFSVSDSSPVGQANPTAMTLDMTKERIQKLF